MPTPMRPRKQSSPFTLNAPPISSPMGPAIATYRAVRRYARTERRAAMMFVMPPSNYLWRRPFLVRRSAMRAGGRFVGHLRCASLAARRSRYRGHYGLRRRRLRGRGTGHRALRVAGLGHEALFELHVDALFDGRRRGLHHLGDLRDDQRLRAIEHALLAEREALALGEERQALEHIGHVVDRAGAHLV